jgi:hypothetical protein
MQHYLCNLFRRHTVLNSILIDPLDILIEILELQLEANHGLSVHLQDVYVIRVERGFLSLRNRISFYP